MIDYCEAKENLKVKAIIMGLQTLSESQQAGDRTLSDTINRFVQNSINFIKKDEDTQEEVISYLLQDEQSCSDPFFR